MNSCINPPGRWKGRQRFQHRPAVGQYIIRGQLAENSRCVEGVEGKGRKRRGSFFSGRTRVDIPPQIREYDASISATTTGAISRSNVMHLAGSPRDLSFRNNPTRSGRLWNAALRHSKRIDRDDWHRGRLKGKFSDEKNFRHFCVWAGGT